jgi:hypothetical protein
MSVKMMTSSPHTSARPQSLLAQTPSAPQSLPALALVAVFLAKAIAMLGPPLAHQ